MANVSSILPHREECVYTKCYCEENVWKLCYFIQNKFPEILTRCFCVFISNKERRIPLWCQQSSKRSDKLVIWDYHVIFVYNEGSEAWVFDLDTTLPFPCTFYDYVESALQSESNFKEEFKRWFRVIEADTYLKTFASDRSHMLNEDGTYLSPCPNYPPIKTDEEVNNLEEFIRMDSQSGFGNVMDCQQFVNNFPFIVNQGLT